MMKKVIYLLFIMIALLGISGCDADKDNLSEKAIEQGKLAMANQEYDKALSSFDLALTEGTEDVQIKEMYDIIKKYKEAEEYLEKEDFEKADRTLKEINSNYTRYAIKEDIDRLREGVDNKQQPEAKEDKQDKQDDEKKSEKLEPVKPKPVVEAPKKPEPVAEVKPVAKNEVKSRKDEYIRKMDNLEQNYRNLSSVYTNGTDEEIYQAEYENYEAWDKLINEIWSVLKTQLSKEDMAELSKIQNQWIKNKESTAESDELDYGYDRSGIVYISTVGSLTRDRCYELVNLYMK